MVRRLIFGGILLLILIAGTPASAAAQTVLIATPSPVVVTDSVFVSAFRFTNGKGFDYVELYNADDTLADVATMRVVLRYADTATDYECNISMHGYLRPQQYITFAQKQANVAGDTALLYAMDGCQTPAIENFDREIQVYRGQTLVESVRILAGDMGTSASKAWERGGFTATYKKGVLATDFKASKRVSAVGDAVYSSALYIPEQTLGLQLLEVLPHPNLCGMGTDLLLCKPYIKVYNPTDTDIVLDMLRLRSGQVTEKSSAYNTSYLSGVLAAKTWQVINQDTNGKPLAIDDKEAALWFEDALGAVAYENTWQPYAGADTVAHKGHAWAFDESEGTWKWALANPLEKQPNFTFPVLATPEKTVATALAPCKDGQYRSEETNRCRSIALAGDTLTPCKDGQYRSEESGRCRSIAATAAAELKPCADDQFRNPDTGRCKKIASTEDELQPCDEGWERNPDTNRCRKIKATDMPLAAFPVQPVAPSQQSVLSWWALGGVGLAAAGYGTWEWRAELGTAHAQDWVDCDACRAALARIIKPMRIIGIDPGTGILGFGVIDAKAGKTKLVTAGVITTPAHTPLPDRLKEIYEGLNDIIAETSPQVMAIEKLFFAQNVTTAISVSHARGVAMLTGCQAGLRIEEYTPLQIKQTMTGYGRATKKQIQEMVRLQLNLTESPKPDDCADALAAAIMCAFVLRSQADI